MTSDPILNNLLSCTPSEKLKSSYNDNFRARISLKQQIIVAKAYVLKNNVFFTNFSSNKCRKKKEEEQLKRFKT